MKKLIDKFVCDYDLICPNNAKFCVDIGKYDRAIKFDIKYIFLCNSHLNIFTKEVRVSRELKFYINKKYNNYKYTTLSISFIDEDNNIVYYTIEEFKKMILLE